MLPLNTNIRLAYSNGKDDEQNFIQNLSLFLCTFLKEHGQLIEKRPNLREALMEVRNPTLVDQERASTRCPKFLIYLVDVCRWHNFSRVSVAACQVIYISPMFKIYF